MEKSGDKNAKIYGYVYKTIANKSYISALIKVTPDVSTGSLDALGIIIGTKAGNIWDRTGACGAGSRIYLSTGNRIYTA